MFSNGHVINYAYLANDGSEIIEKEHLRDLGVTMSNNAAFQDHISNIARSSRMKLGWILRTFQTQDRTAMLTLSKALVIPILDYCNQLWSPWTKTDIRNIESVRKTLTRSISEVRHLNYWERLSYLRLYLLERRRERYMIMYIWKMITGLVSSIVIPTKHQQQHGRSCEIRRIARVNCQN